jgi:hypothetical protein
MVPFILRYYKGSYQKHDEAEVAKIVEGREYGCGSPG